jgi:hypothetical protein
MEVLMEDKPLTMDREGLREDKKALPMDREGLMEDKKF